MRFISFGHVVAVSAVLALAAGDVAAQTGATTATVRGRVTNESGQPVATAQVVVRNTLTGVQKGAVSNADGVYVVPFIEPGGPYTVSVESIGFGAGAREFERFQLGEVVVVNFQLRVQAVAVEGLEVSVETVPLIETKQAGVIDRVNAIQIEALPTNGRNFADFVALSSNVQTDVGDGSGGNLSLGGGRRGANNITIDGVNNNGTFFGGEARGSDRIAFAFSIETVKEFQVITNGYDVEFGNFTGGQINAITKGGTNQFEASGFWYKRDEALIGDDFDGIPPDDFSSDQFGGMISGPIIRDKAHFLVSFDRQDRANPVRSLLPGDAVGRISDAALNRFISIMQSVYGYDASNEFQVFSQSNDETALFARVDWQLNENHALTIRNNNTDLVNNNDRVSSNEGQSNGGVFNDESNSLAINLKSVLSPRVFNDFRFQWAVESRPRTAASLLPEIEVFQTSSVGGRNVFQDIEIFNDPVLPNSLDEDVIQVVDNLVWQAGDHTIKVGTNNQFYDIDNFFWFGARGQFEFNGLDDLEAGISSKYNIATPGPDGSTPRAIYNVSEHAFYAQDEWAVNDRLTFTFGLRYDVTLFPDTPETNADLLAEFPGFDTGNFPEDKNNVSPRFGFALDMNGDGRSVLRGGAGLFFGRVPAVFWSNALLNDGVSQGTVQCQGSFFESPEARAAVIAILRGERPTFQSCGEIPGGRGFAFTPNINVMKDDLQWPGSWKFNLGYDREIANDLRVGIEVMHARTDNNFYNQDANLLAPQFYSAREFRPVFAPTSGFRSNGSLRFGRNRVSSSFNDVLVLVDEAESRTWQANFEIEKRFSDNWTAQVTYGLSRTNDNTSSSCCISSTAIFETPTAASPNDLGDPGDEFNSSWGPADFDRTHTIVASAVYNNAFGVDGLRLSGFYRGQSGTPWTPVVDGDVNGDGRFGNDRAFIPTTGDLSFDSPEDAATYQQLLSQFDCLRDQLGTIADRNSCRNPWVHTLDTRISWRVPTVTGQSVELIADVFNVLNLFNSDWGQNRRVFDTELFRVEGFDAGAQEFTYSTLANFGEENIFGFSPRQWQIQLGVRYNVR